MKEFWTSLRVTLLICTCVIAGSILSSVWAQQVNYNIPLSTIAAGTGGSFSVGGNVMFVGQTPTISGTACFNAGGTASVLAGSVGSGAFKITVGGTPSSATCPITFSPPAANGYSCSCADITTNSTSVFVCKQTAATTTSATLQIFSDVAVAAAPTAADVVNVQCSAF